MVVYLDQVFLLNMLSDAAALYATARLSGLPLLRSRFALASILGGFYGVLCCLPIPFLDSLPVQFVLAALLIKMTFKRQESFFRILALFYILSSTLGGAVLALSHAITSCRSSSPLDQINWKVFFLASIISYFLMSIIFRGGAKHAVAGDILPVKIVLGEQTARLNALWDTGHTLQDPYTDVPVLTVWCQALEPLLTKEERKILNQLEAKGSLWCTEQLGTISPGKFRLLPYRAVGIHRAFLLSFQADEALIGKAKICNLTIALSPTPVSDGGGYTALWGGERKEEPEYAVSNEVSILSRPAAFGLDSSR